MRRYNVADAEVMQSDLDNRGPKILGNDTFEFVYGGDGEATGDVTGATSAFGGFGGAGGGATPTLTDLSFGGFGGAGGTGAFGAATEAAAAEAAAEAAAAEATAAEAAAGVAVAGAAAGPEEGVDLNLSDSFDVPPGADAAAASVMDHDHGDGDQGKAVQADPIKSLVVSTWNQALVSKILTSCFQVCLNVAFNFPRAATSRRARQRGSPQRPHRTHHPQQRRPHRYGSAC